MKHFKTFAVAAMVCGLSLVSAQTASAAFITGSISISDGFDPGGIPGAPTTSIVSGLTNWDLNNAVNTYVPGSATGDLLGTTSATVSDFSVLPTTFFTTDTGFTFTLTSAVPVITDALSCIDTLCTDRIIFAVAGTASKAGFTDTAFIGSFTANGSCIGAASTCLSNITAGWSASVVATGRETVPEPATMALFGLGLLGAGVARRRRS